MLFWCIMFAIHRCLCFHNQIAIPLPPPALIRPSFPLPRYVKFDPLGFKLITAISIVSPPPQENPEPLLRQARPAAAADPPPPPGAGAAGGGGVLESAHRNLTHRYVQLQAQFRALRHQRTLERSLRQVGSGGLSS